jgi:flavin reductase (DIM6/NTAB) family NADH-FMN oxidoreductase RutF
MVVAEPPSLIDRDLFRHVIGHFASGVTVITARHDRRDFGVTASAVASLSMEPPMMLVCLNRRLGTQQAVSATRAFAVNILADGQHAMAEQFATPHPDKFRGIAVDHGELGVPLLRDALAHLECRVVEEVRGGTHTVFLAEVQTGDARDGSPLAYFRGSFGRLELARDEAVFQEIRGRVLDRSLPIGKTLELDALARELEVERAPVYYALAKLSAQGLVARAAGRGYCVRPIDVRAARDAFDARCAIELGVVDLTVSRVSPGRLADLRARMEATLPWVRDGRFVDFERYLEANRLFHEGLVGLADNDGLLLAYRQLSLDGVISRALGAERRTSDRVTEDHRRLVEAYEAGDEQLAREIVIAHAELAKERVARVLHAQGGEI